MANGNPPGEAGGYRVDFSGRALEELRALIERARAAGLGDKVLDAVSEMHRLLAEDPRSGDPLTDLVHAGATTRVLTVPPLVVEYALFEDVRAVIVTKPVRVLPRAGF